MHRASNKISKQAKDINQQETTHAHDHTQPEFSKNTELLNYGKLNYIDTGQPVVGSKEEEKRVPWESFHEKHH